MQNNSKVFGIGLSKTGTTSLTQALRILGYRSVHFPIFHLQPKRYPLQLNLKNIARWDAATDTPIPYFYKQLDQAFPGSKFILTVRNIDQWLTSCEYNHVWPGEYIHDKAISRFLYVSQFLNIHHSLYGAVWFDRQRFKYYYQKHIEDVREYFKGRPEDLLIYDISGGEEWQPLCEFLKAEVPGTQFPEKNVGTNKIMKKKSRRLIWQSLAWFHFGHRIDKRYTPADITFDST